MLVLACFFMHLGGSRMKSIGIVTDSHGGISQAEADKYGVKILPMPLLIGEESFLENVSISREQFFERLNNNEKPATSQPSPEQVMTIWRDALSEYEQILHMPISSGLSGSCNTARMLAQQDEFEGKVFVVDNGRISTPMHRSILDALELIEKGYRAEEIKNILEASKGDMSIYIAVETLEHLKNGGRISATSAAIGTALNIKPILQLNVGLLESYRKVRGMKKAKREMLESMKQDFETKFKKAYKNGDIYLLAASSADEETTQKWVEEIKAYFPGMDVLCDNLSLGISCHTGEGALGIGCSCKPKA